MLAHKRMKEIGGGIVLTENGKILHEIPPQLSGCASAEPFETVLQQIETLRKSSHWARLSIWLPNWYTRLFPKYTFAVYSSDTKRNIWCHEKNCTLSVYNALKYNRVELYHLCHISDNCYRADMSNGSLHCHVSENTYVELLKQRALTWRVKWPDWKMILSVTLADQHMLNNWARRGACLWSRRAFRTTCIFRADLMKQKWFWYRKQTSLSDCRTRKMTELVDFVYDKEASAYERTDGISSVEPNLSWFVQSSLLRLKKIVRKDTAFSAECRAKRCQ